MAVFEREDEQRLLRPPRLRTLEQGDRRHATYLELFFDLVFVVAIAQLSHELVLDHSLGGFATFAALYLPVFIAWQGFSSYADRFDTDDVVFRGVMFLAMLAIAALAIQIVAALTALSAGVSLAIEQSSSSQLDAGARWALAGGAALYLAFVTVAQAASAQGLRVNELRARIGAGLALVALALVGGALDPVVFMVSAATVLVGVVVLKLWTARPVVARAPAAPWEPPSP